MICGLIEVVAESPVGHVVVDEDHLALLVAESDERDEVDVAKQREHLDLCPELTETLFRLRVREVAA
jgi:hypothetical protein